MNMQVNIAPTWGEIGVIVRRLAISGEQHAAILKIWPEAARAFAAAEALHQVMPLLNNEQKGVVAKTLTQELGKQGY